MSHSSQQQVIDPEGWRRLQAEGRHEELCRRIVDVVNWYGERTQSSMDAGARQQITELLQLILSLVSQPTFIVPDDFSVPFIFLNRTLSNLAAMTPMKNTDLYLEHLRAQPHNFVKILMLYSARNMSRFDARSFFSLNAELASVWYIQYAMTFHAGLSSEIIFKNLRDHMSPPPEGLLPFPGMMEVFFGSTYIDPEADRHIKQVVNQTIRRRLQAYSIHNRSNPRKIAVLSSLWHRQHSIYRTFYDFVRALKPHYHLTLFNLGNHFEAETSLFDEVRVIATNGGIPDPTPILENDFQLLYYPDIGMTDESLFMANLRLAPIQVTTIGHSVSTFGADIDYFISGAGVESPDNPQQYYSERLVLLPGMGCTHLEPRMPRAVRAESKDTPLLINCPWGGHKINLPFMKTVAALLRSCRRPVRLQIFESGATIHRNDFVPFKDTLAGLLGADQFEVIINLPYPEYMAKLRAGHLALDSFHFGGCNTVSDSLHLGIPMVCRRGERWYNRIGPRMLELAGVPELVAESEEEYLRIAGRLIEDDGFRQSLRSRLLATDLKESIYRVDEAGHFKKAIDYLIGHHGELQRAAPGAIYAKDFVG